jgi:hypothetical protein
MSTDLDINCNDFIRCLKARCHLETKYLNFEQIQECKKYVHKKERKIAKKYCMNPYDKDCPRRYS